MRSHVGRDCCGRAEQTDDLGSDLARASPRRRSFVDIQRVLAWVRLFEGVDLAPQQARRHEVAVTPGQMLGYEIPTTAKIDEPHFRAVADDDLAVGAFERRAGDNSGLFFGPPLIDPGRDALEPWSAVLIGQW